MTKHKYMFSYTANDYDGNLVAGHYILTGKELLHLHINTFNESTIVVVEKEIGENTGYIFVMVNGITELPMKVKR